MANIAGQILPLVLAPETGGASLEVSAAGAVMNEAGKMDGAAEGVGKAEGSSGEGENQMNALKGLIGKL